MGSSKETITSLQTIDLMKHTNGFSTHITRMYAKGARSAQDICRGYIKDKSTMLNTSVFENLGVNAKADFIEEKITKNTISQYIASFFPGYSLNFFSDDYDVTKDIGRIIEFTKIDTNHTWVGSSDPYYNKSVFVTSITANTKIPYGDGFNYPNGNFVIVSSPSNEYGTITIYNGEEYQYGYTWHYDYPTWDRIIDKYYYGVMKLTYDNSFGRTRSTYKFYILFTIEQKTYQNIEIQGFKTISNTTYNNNGTTINATIEKYYRLKNLNIGTNADGTNFITYQYTYYVIRDATTGSIVEEGDGDLSEENVNLPYYNKKYIIINMSNGTNEKNIIVSRGDILKEATKLNNCLLVPIKKDFSMTNVNSGEIKVVLLRLGLGGISFDEIANNPDLKHFAISYMAKKGEEIYNIVKPYYNKAIRIQGNGFVLNYSENGTSVSIGTSGKGDGGEPTDTIAIPLELLGSLGFKAFYDNVSNVIRAYAYAQKTIKHKWYETGFFSFILHIVLGVIAFATGNFEIFLALEAINIAVNALNISPELKQAIMLIISLAMTDISKVIKNVTNAIETAFKISQDIFKIFSTKEFEKYKKELEGFISSTSKMKKEIENIFKPIINPFDDIMYNPDMKFYLAYDFPYNDAYNIATTSQMQG